MIKMFLLAILMTGETVVADQGEIFPNKKICQQRAETIIRDILDTPGLDFKEVSFTCTAAVSEVSA